MLGCRCRPREGCDDSREVGRAPSGPCGGLGAVYAHLPPVAVMAGPPVPARVAVVRAQVQAYLPNRLPGQSYPVHWRVQQLDALAPACQELAQDGLMAAAAPLGVSRSS